MGDTTVEGILQQRQSMKQKTLAQNEKERANFVQNR